MGLWLKYTGFILVYIPYRHVCTLPQRQWQTRRTIYQDSCCMTEKTHETTEDLWASSWVIYFALVSDKLLVTATSMSWRQPFLARLSPLLDFLPHTRSNYMYLPTFSYKMPTKLIPYLHEARCVPYSGKFSRGRNFRNFHHRMPSRENLFPRKFLLWKVLPDKLRKLSALL